MPQQPLGPLAGVLVVDLTRALAGPHATMMLGDLGARVVKVEAPGRGDDSRTWGPPFLEREGELTQLLSDRRATADQKRQLLASVLYGKVTMYTEALALQVVGRPEHNPVDDIAAVSRESAELTGKTVAEVTSATELTDAQRDALADKLGTIYGREMAIHSEVDPSLLGGATIRVGDELIDGSTRGKLSRLRADMAANTAY